MKNRKLGILLIIVIVFFIGVIISFSLQPAQESAETSSRVTRFIARHFVRGFNEMKPLKKMEIISSMDNLVRKCAHFTEYTLLGILLLLFFRNLNAVRRPLYVTVPAGIAVAAADEFLVQFFIPGRSPEWRDVLIDTAGIVTGAVLILLVILIVKKTRARKRKAAA